MPKKIQDPKNIIFFPERPEGFPAARKLRLLCSGKPATVPWPHRALHDAADTIDRLISAVVAYKTTTELRDIRQAYGQPLPDMAKVHFDLVRLADEFGLDGT